MPDSLVFNEDEDRFGIGTRAIGHQVMVRCSLIRIGDPLKEANPPLSRSPALLFPTACVVFSLNVESGKLYYIVVDGYGAAAQGNFEPTFNLEE